MKYEVYLPILGIAAGEIMMFFGEVYPGLAIHIINLQVLTLLLTFSSFPSEIKMIYQSLILLLLLRIINLAMPQFFTITLLWYPMTYGIMYMPVFMIIRHQNIYFDDLGMNLKRLQIYIPAAIFLGAIAALMEFSILKPISLIENVGLSNLILIGIVMFVFVGAIEELIFRSILLTRLEKVLDPKTALLLSSMLFGIMHSGYGRIDELIFAVILGIILGYIFQKTRSFPFIMVMHGTANILLFGILPIISALS